MHRICDEPKNPKRSLSLNSFENQKSKIKNQASSANQDLKNKPAQNGEKIVPPASISSLPETEIMSAFSIVIELVRSRKNGTV